METINRREFVKTTAGAAIATPFISALGRAHSPNDTINLAVIGLRSRGQAHYEGFGKIPGVRIATFCDVDERLFPEAQARLGKVTQQKPGTETDIRRVLDDKTIDAVTIATPDHWHALAAIWACQAGKDVYVEKPVSHNIWEGRQIVNAARKNNPLVEAGSKNRSNPSVQAAMKFLHDGGIGEVYMAKGLCFKPRDTIGHKPDSTAPPGVHYVLGLRHPPSRAS